MRGVKVYIEYYVKVLEKNINSRASRRIFKILIIDLYYTSVKVKYLIGVTQKLKNSPFFLIVI